MPDDDGPTTTRTAPTTITIATIRSGLEEFIDLNVSDRAKSFPFAFFVDKLLSTVNFLVFSLVDN